ncbi:hypothetical protein CEXT_79571 [Caerostris extrusa]|uniref:Secreted protein n=1 Tax=Caerostris extrusa TaxID=172846 RepID=A0AAV4NAT7_CAEEX|nr:hypothetical protein CEXT_79571 [Caerostris extrusa]
MLLKNEHITLLTVAFFFFLFPYYAIVSCFPESRFSSVYQVQRVPDTARSTYRKGGKEEEFVPIGARAFAAKQIALRYSPVWLKASKCSQQKKTAFIWATLKNGAYTPTRRRKVSRM